MVTEYVVQIQRNVSRILCHRTWKDLEDKSELFQKTKISKLKDHSFKDFTCQKLPEILTIN